jgi:hypothetical protein
MFTHRVAGAEPATDLKTIHISRRKFIELATSFGASLAFRSGYGPAMRVGRWLNEIRNSHRICHSSISVDTVIQ